MDYSFITTPEGNIQTSQGGKIISTGTAESAATMYGYKAPVATPPQVQQTTTSMRTTASQNSDKLDTKLTNLGTTAETKKANLTSNPVDPNAKPDNSAGAGVTMNEATARQLFGNDFTGLKSNPDGSYTADSVAMGRLNGTTKTGSDTVDPNSPEGVKSKLSSDISSANTNAQTKVDNVNKTLDGIVGLMDESSDALIAGLKDTYNSSMALLKESNDKMMKAKTQAGLRSGISRYASDIQDSIISDEEQAGVLRINDLKSKMLNAIAQAQQARAKNDLDVFNKRMDDVNKIGDDLRTEVQNLNTNASNTLKNINDKMKADSDTAKQQQADMLTKSANVAGSVAEKLATITDPAKQAEFLETYAKQSGIDPDILWNDILDYNQKSKKANLDIENIQSEMTARAESTKNANAKRNQDEGVDEMNNVINGVSTIGDIDKSKKEAVKAKLQSLGFYSSTVPKWFIQAQNDMKKQEIDPKELQKMWDEYRKKATTDTSL